MGEAEVDPDTRVSLLRAALEQAPQAVLLLLEDGRVRYANTAARAQFSLDVPDVLPVELAAGGVLDALRAGEAQLERRLVFRRGSQARHHCLCLHRLDGIEPATWLLQLRDDEDRRQVEEQLQRCIAFEQLIGRVSADLMRAAAPAVDACIERALARVGAFFGVDRAYVFRIPSDAAIMSNTHEWVGEGIAREAPNLQGIPLDTFPWLMRELNADRTVLVADVAGLPDSAASERGEFEREGIRSIAIVPMRRGADLSGFVGFDAVRSRIDWTDDYVLGLRLLSQLIVGALESRDLALRLTELAYHDALTGLPNRPLLEDRLQRALARCERTGGCLSLLLIDLDDFKQVNDCHGHAVGDRLLIEVAERLRSTVREPDTVARLGGDEFVLLVESSDPGHAIDIAERVQRALQRPCTWDHLALPIGCSIGIATMRGEGRAADLMRCADAAMYRAKREGKRRWKLAESLRDG